MYNNFNTYQTNDRRECPCGMTSMQRPHDNCSDLPVAMAYVPWQYFTQVYELPMALQAGTTFPELNKPFRGSKGGKKCGCRQ